MPPAFFCLLKGESKMDGGNASVQDVVSRPPAEARNILRASACLSPAKMPLDSVSAYYSSLSAFR